MAAVLLAILLEALFAGLVWIAAILSPSTPPKPENHPTVVSLRPLSAQDWAENRGAPLPPPPKRAEKKPTPPRPEKNPEGQVVDVAPGNDVKPSDDAKYLATHDNSVKHQTRAREQTPDYRNAMPQRTRRTKVPALGHDVANRAQVAGNGGLRQDAKPLHRPSAHSGAMKIPDVKARSEVALRMPKSHDGVGPTVVDQPKSQALKGNARRLQIAPGKPGSDQDATRSWGHLGRPGLANLLPSPSVMDKLTGAAPNDDLHDLDEGDQTLLNTKEWKYASFFNRVKQAVGMAWHPDVVLQERDPTGEVYGHRDRFTRVAVTLTDRGTIKEIHITKSSGLEFLDMEAVHSFERAQPFPDPPRGMLEADSTVHFEFGFFLQLSGSPLLRLFRGP